MDNILQAFFEITITIVKRKYGLLVAWICAIAMVSITIGLLYVVVTWWL